MQRLHSGWWIVVKSSATNARVFWLKKIYDGRHLFQTNLATRFHLAAPAGCGVEAILVLKALRSGCFNRRTLNLP